MCPLLTAFKEKNYCEMKMIPITVNSVFTIVSTLFSVALLVSCVFLLANTQGKQSQLEERVAQLEKTVQQIVEQIHENRRPVVDEIRQSFVSEGREPVQRTESVDIERNQFSDAEKPKTFYRQFNNSSAVESSGDETHYWNLRNELELDKKQLPLEMWRRLKRSTQQKNSSEKPSEQEKQVAVVSRDLTLGLEETRKQLNKLTVETNHLLVKMNKTEEELNAYKRSISRDLKAIPILINLLNTTMNFSECQLMKQELQKEDKGQFSLFQKYLKIFTETVHGSYRYKELENLRNEFRFQFPHKALFSCDFVYNATFPIGTLFVYKHSLLHVAAMVDDVETAQLLLWRGANVHLALHFAALYNSIQVVKLLLENGANVQQTTMYNETALHFAVSSNAVEAASILIQHGADVNALDHTSSSPLSSAAFSKSVGVMKLLLDSNAQIDLQDFIGQSALHWAVLGNCFDCVKMLVERGANTRLRDEEGKTAYQLAFPKDHKGDKRFFEFLKDFPY